MTGNELHYIADAHARGHLSGGGYYTMKCNEWMKSVAGTRRALLTQSCTAALEIASMLLNIEPGDEVYAYDHLNDRLTVGSVSGISSNWAQHLVKIHTDDEVISATLNHSFWVESRGEYLRADHCGRSRAPGSSGRSAF